MIRRYERSLDQYAIFCNLKLCWALEEWTPLHRIHRIESAWQYFVSINAKIFNKQLQISRFSPPQNLTKCTFPPKKSFRHTVALDRQTTTKIFCPQIFLSSTKKIAPPEETSNRQVYQNLAGLTAIWEQQVEVWPFCSTWPTLWV